MKELNKPVSQPTQGALARLLGAIRNRYPAISETQAENVRSKVINYVSDGIADGYDLALIKRKDDRTILKVLKLMEEEDEQL